MYQAIYFADAVTGKCLEVSGSYFLQSCFESSGTEDKRHSRGACNRWGNRSSQRLWHVHMQINSSLSSCCVRQENLNL